MTTNTENTVNTEFSLPVEAVKADIEVVVAVERCEEGKELRRAWVLKYKESTIDNWQDILMRGFEPYLRHFAKCDQCKEFEYTLRDRLLTITEEEK